MCSIHQPFLFPCFSCLISLHNSYHFLILLYYILVKLSVICVLPWLPWHTFSYFFFFVSNCFFSVSYWNLLGLWGLCPRPNYSIHFVPTSTPVVSITTSMCQLDLCPKCQAPGWYTYIHTNTASWVASLGLPHKYFGLNMLNSWLFSKFVLQVFCLFGFLFFFE